MQESACKFSFYKNPKSLNNREKLVLTYQERNEIFFEKEKRELRRDLRFLK